MLKGFIDSNYNFYQKTILSNNIKNILKEEPKFITLKNNKIIYQLDNIQFLYLYPLSILDYVNNLKHNYIISLNIIEIDTDINYEELLSDKKFDNLKSVEILINTKPSTKELKKIAELIYYFNYKNIKITLNIKNLNNIPTNILDTFKYADYLKIFMPNILNTKKYNIFLNNIKYISEIIDNNILINIKSYLNINQSKYYENAIKDFSKYKIDIFQVSKELIPLNKENIKVDIKIQNKIRNLEKKYNDYNNTKFISVKDLSILYYPRFELDDRNSKKCYACKMKPYLYKDKLLPCKVQKIFNDINNWSSKYNDKTKYNNVVNKCGISCDDCASIFENDTLYYIENILNKNKNITYFLKIGE